MDHPAESCPSCRAAVAHDQRHCLSCGARVAAPVVDWRALATASPSAPEATLRSATPAWGLPPSGRMAAALVLACLGTGGLLGGAAVPADSSTAAPRSVVALAQPAVSSTPTPTPAPTPAGSGGGASLPDDTSQSVAAPASSQAPADVAQTSAPAPAPDPDPGSAIPAAEPTPEPTPEPAAPSQPSPDENTPADPPAPKGPSAKHVVIVSLTGQDAKSAFAPGSAAAYLAHDLPSQGVLLRRYTSVARGSLAGQVALLAGAAPTPEQDQDCPDPVAACVLPAHTPTLPGELADSARSWKAYVQGRRQPCGAPGRDSAFGAFSRDPFPYLAELRADCPSADVELAGLAADFSSTDLAPSLAYVVPDACHDGREAIVCTDAPGTTGLQRADAFLREWVPAITGSPAFADDGLLIVVFDGGGLPPRAEDDEPVAVGAVVVGRFAPAGKVSRHPYDHLSLLRTLAGTYGVKPPGRAADDGVRELGRDVFPAAG